MEKIMTAEQWLKDKLPFNAINVMQDDEVENTVSIPHLLDDYAQYVLEQSRISERLIVKMEHFPKLLEHPIDIPQWFATIPSMKGLAESASTKEDAFRELMISLAVKIAYDSKLELDGSVFTGAQLQRGSIDWDKLKDEFMTTKEMDYMYEDDDVQLDNDVALWFLHKQTIFWWFKCNLFKTGK
jgi:predicted RNase H-like HicB family nuclease